ncbi:hypothetical protein [Parvibaculum sp.]
MATRKRKSTRRKSRVGLKANGTLKKGYRFKKGGGVVKARKR